MLREPKTVTTLRDLDNFLALGAITAIDLETKGLELDADVIGVGLANIEGCIYIPLLEAPDEFRTAVWQRVVKKPLVAHNMLFDASFIWRESGVCPNIEGCTLVLFKLLATEGWQQQQWNLATLQEDILGIRDSQKDWLKNALTKHKLTKKCMWQLHKYEPEKFGDYCALDADAAYQGWMELNRQLALEPELRSIRTFHDMLFMPELRLLLEQQRRGIAVDSRKLAIYNQQLSLNIISAREEFLNHNTTSPYIKEYNSNVVIKLMEKEPSAVTKTGKPSKNWERWSKKLDQQRVTNHFNVNSTKQLSWLFYERLGYKPSRTTPGGAPYIGSKALHSLGDEGKLLLDYRKVVKEESYVAKCRDTLDTEGVLHPRFKLHGTFTGRLGGDGGFNIQQQPKSRGYLECWKARPGYKLVQCDFSAIEPVALTEGSGDPTLWKLYGPGAKPNDIYLFVGANSIYRKDFRRHYDPDCPTPEGISYLKKHRKLERAICKKLHLMKQYKAGVKNMHLTLREEGIDIDLADVIRFNSDWRALFRGIENFEEQLLNEWEHNDGWFKNGIGRPMAIDEWRIKDIVNSWCQSTGHDVLLMTLNIIEKMRAERGIEMHPWICDYHDEWIFECLEKEVPLVLKLYRDAVTEVNEILGWRIQVQAEPQVAGNLAEIKCE